VAISRGDAIVHCAKVGSGGDEVDVVIGIVILLKFYRIEAESS